MDSASWQTLFTVAGAVFIAYLQYKTKRTVEEVHTLVNGAMSNQLKINAVLARKIAVLPDSSQEDVELAKQTEQSYKEHKSIETKLEIERGSPFPTELPKK